MFATSKPLLIGNWIKSRDELKKWASSKFKYKSHNLRGTFYPLQETSIAQLHAIKRSQRVSLTYCQQLVELGVLNKLSGQTEIIRQSTVERKSKLLRMLS